MDSKSKNSISESPPTATPTTNSSSNASKKKKPLPLPPNWVKVMSDKGPYYWNKELNTTQWKFPRDEALAFVNLQKSHGYINLPPSSSSNPTTAKTRSRTSQRRSKTVSNTRSSPLMKSKVNTTSNGNGNESSMVLKGELECEPSDTVPYDEVPPTLPPPCMSHDNEVPPTLPPPLMSHDNEVPPTLPPPCMSHDNEVPPTLPPPLMSHDNEVPPTLPLMSRDVTNGNNDSPPPVPARNYTENDLMELNDKKTEEHIPSSPGDSPPPPIPTRTELSTQLVTPPTKSNLPSSHFIYNSNLSDLSVIGRSEEPSLLVRPPLVYDEIPGPLPNTSRGSSVINNRDSDPVVYDEVPDSMRPSTRLPHQRSLDDRLIDNRPRLPDPVVQQQSNNCLIYDQIIDSSTKSASRSRTKLEPPSVEPSSTAGPTGYNTLNFGSTTITTVIPSNTGTTGTTGTVNSLYDEVFDPRSGRDAPPPPSSVSNEVIVYDEVPSDLSQRVVPRDPSNGGRGTSTPPVYNELDLSSVPPPRLPANDSKKPLIVAQSLPRNSRLGGTTSAPPSSKRHGVGGSHPPPIQSPPPPPTSTSSSPPSPGDRPPPTLPPARTPPTDKKLTKSESLNPRITPPPSRRTPPLVHNSTPANDPRDVSPLPPIAAYEVVPLNPTRTSPSNLSKPRPQQSSKQPQPTDDIFMTVNHEAQLQRFQRFGGSLRSTHTPPVSSRRCGSTSYHHTNKNNTIHSSNPSLDIEYDHLNHNRRSCSTLPRANTTSSSSTSTTNSTYSTLQREKVAEMRAGVKVHGSQMSDSHYDLATNLSQESVIELIHAPSVSSPEIKRREHLYEEFIDDKLPSRRHSLGGDTSLVPMIYAPDQPSTDIVQRKQHQYEIFDQDQSNERNTPSDYNTSSPQLIRKSRPPVEGKSTPTLVWEDDLNEGTPGFKEGQTNDSIPQPSSVTNKDYERRIMRLENHSYGEIDIPEWPNQQPTLAVTSPSDIKRVVRESWLTPNKASGDDLPEGWTKELNEQGQEFYWHIPTGKLQYVKPAADSHLRSSKSCSPGDSDVTTVSSPTTTNTTFAAEYWGSCTVPENNLVKGRSVQVVLNCIRNLLDENSPFTLYGGLKQRSRVHIQVTNTDLCWLSTDTNHVLISQPINKIRVWGVGQDNDREFGYIARNQATKLHVCHIFMCDIAAMGIAQAMLNSHNVGGSGTSSRRPSMDTDLSAGDIGNNESIGGGTVLVQVPLAGAHRQRSVTNKMTQDGQSIHDSSPPPTDEDTNHSQSNAAENYKRLEAIYIGFTDVLGARGIDVLNEAVAQLSIAKSRWLPVYVDIATSHIKILDKKTEQVLKEHRVRFLSFLGIATDDRYCGYVVDNGDNQFLFHGFQCLPNADRLCLALHAACQARYQRVIDAHLNEGEQGNIDSSTRQKRSLLSRIGSWKSKQSQSQVDEDSKPSSSSFIVQFLGYELVPKPNGVDSIKEPLKKVSLKTSGVHLVELVVTKTGFTINDPQKKYFASKHIYSKKIAYCAKVRSHFVFIAREGSKHYCYMFAESDIALSRITVAINQIMN